MQAHRIETTLTQDGTLTVDGLPMRAGDTVEVTVLVKKAANQTNAYPLRGTPVRYQDPTEPVALEEWEALR